MEMAEVSVFCILPDLIGFMDQDVKTSCITVAFHDGVKLVLVELQHNAHRFAEILQEPPCGVTVNLATRRLLLLDSGVLKFHTSSVERPPGNADCTRNSNVHSFVAGTQPDPVRNNTNCMHSEAWDILLDSFSPR
jgi:hypothetical protein